MEVTQKGRAPEREVKDDSRSEDAVRLTPGASVAGVRGLSSGSDDHTLGQENPPFSRCEHKDGVAEFNWHWRFVEKNKEVGKKI